MSTGKDSGTGNGGGASHGYLYDVFLSYSYKSDVQEWVVKKFLQKFVNALENELIQLGQVEPPPKGYVCVARREIKPGDPWPEELQEQLQRSRVMVAVCSPPYFISGWCRSEWETFRNRAPKLLIPVLYYGKDEFLVPRVQPIQYVDFRDFQDIPPARVAMFNQKIRSFAEVVATKVVAAPHFNTGGGGIGGGGAPPVVLPPVPVTVPFYTL